MKKCFCTIITSDYLPFAYALNDSLVSFDADIELRIMISDWESDLSDYEVTPSNIKCFLVKDVCKEGIGRSIFEKYWTNDMDKFRWSMKPVFMHYLLTEAAYDKVIHADWDLFFYHDYSFLFEELDRYKVLLSPHWRCSTPFSPNTSLREQSNFQFLFNKGMFNGGLVGANKHAVDAMQWWGNACEYVCLKDEKRGFFDDQSHLNLLPVIFEDIGIIRHKGCNIANWNQVDCKRVDDGKAGVKINGEWDIIFIHFTASTILGILYEDDQLLKPYLDQYVKALKKYTAELDLYARIPSLTEGPKASLKHGDTLVEGLGFAGRLKKLAHYFGGKTS